MNPTSAEAGASRLPELRVVAASSSDAPVIDRLLRGLASYEGMSSYLTYEMTDLVQALEAGRLHAFLARSGDDVVGCLTSTWDYAIWSGCTILRIDDLFVVEGARGRGVGTALMRAAAQLALAERATVRWEVEPANLKAQEFYIRLGAQLREKISARWNTAEMMSVVENAATDTSNEGQCSGIDASSASPRRR